MGVRRCFVLEEVKDAKKIRAFLSSLSDCSEINRQELFDEKRESYNKKYLTFISRINKNNHSFYWWALNFPNKYPLFSDLYNKIISFLIIADLIRRESADCLLIVTGERDVVEQVRLSKVAAEVDLIDEIKENFNIVPLINEYLPLYVALAFLRTILLKLYEHLYLNVSLNTRKRYLVIKSLINRQTQNKDNHYRDAYFGEVHKYLSQKDVPYIFFVTIWAPYITNLKKIKTKDPNLKIIPLEFYVSVYKIMLCFMQSLKRHFLLFSINGKQEIAGLDVSYLLKKEVITDCRTHRFYTNLLEYYCVKALLSRIQIERFIYPFENRSWEQMAIYALREAQKNIKIIGYQHSSITSRHLNLILEDEERAVIPLPDQVITIGEITKGFLETTGNFPKAMLRIGCALRQAIISNSELRKRSDKINNILVVVTSSLDEYVKTLRFLNKSFCNHNLFEIRISPHPIFSIEKAIKLASPLNFNFKVEKDVSIKESLKWADVLLYTSSTVSLEALSLGIPVIYLELGELLKPDPLFGYDGLKWAVSDPDNLLATIDFIDNLPNGEFRILQDKAKEYTRRYFYPVTEENLEQFIIN